MADGKKTVTEYRVIGSDGWDSQEQGYHSLMLDRARVLAVDCDEDAGDGTTHRVQSRTVTTTPWKDVDDA